MLKNGSLSPLVRISLLVATLISLALNGCVKADETVWHFDNLDSIADHVVTLEGLPKVIETPNGKAIEFDGEDDAIFLDFHPLAGMSTFTVEVIFQPYKDGRQQQRFFHMQDDQSDSRVMFETRLVDNEFWFLDCFIKSGEQRVALYAEEHLHKIGPWYHAAMVVEGKTFKHFVNGELELSHELDYKAQLSGNTSVGVRFNKVDWFKGAVRTVRITPTALSPDEFLSAED